MSGPGRPGPFEAVFGEVADRTFPAIRDALSAAGREAADRDAFLMAQPAVELLHELRPEEGLGPRMAEFQALVHHAFLYWASGKRTLSFSRSETEAFLHETLDAGVAESLHEAHYAEFPPRQIWARLAEGAPFEPLDGCFVAPAAGGAVSVLGVFGFHPERAALTVAEAVGPVPVSAARSGGEAFAPMMEGGALAGLHSLASAEELLFLGAATIPTAAHGGVDRR